MPYRRPDPEDPQLFVGMAVPCSASAVREMAFTFAWELSADGLAAERILALFRNPRYVGPHEAYRSLGESTVAGIVRECVDVRARIRNAIRKEES